MKVQIHGEDYDLSFEERLITYATLRHKGVPVRRGATVKHPADRHDPVEARESACLDLAKGMDYPTKISFLSSAAGALTRWEKRLKAPWDTREGKGSITVFRKGKPVLVRLT